MSDFRQNTVYYIGTKMTATDVARKLGGTTVEQATEILGRSKSMIARYCQTGLLPADKISGAWIIRPKALRRFMLPNRHSAGRPRKASLAQDNRATQNRVHSRVVNAIKRGNLIRQPCQECGDPNSHAHHDDYKKPLKVQWLCPSCHFGLHASQRRLNHFACP